MEISSLQLDEEIFIQPKRNLLKAVELISVYYARYLRRTKTRLKRAESANWKLLLAQIEFYPLVRRILFHMLSAVLRRRWKRIWFAAKAIQARWRFKTLGNGESAHLVNRENNLLILQASNLNTTSPAVFLKGRLISGMEELRVNSPLRRPSRNAPLPTEQMALSAKVNENTEMSPKRESAAEVKTVNMTSIPESRRARRIVAAKKPQSTQLQPDKNKSAMPLRMADRNMDLETVRTTLINTKMNSGYKYSTIKMESVLLTKARPPSPSSKFLKSAAVAERKWADIGRARKKTLEDWKQIRSQVSPPGSRKKRLKWSETITFIDESSPQVCSIDPGSSATSVKGILRCRLDDPSLDPTITKRKAVTVQRIIYCEDPPVQKNGGKKRKCEK